MDETTTVDERPARRAAFLCNNCGHIAEAEHAGERTLPLACRVCSAGVHHEIRSGAPVAIAEPENWTVLSDLAEDELADVRERYSLEPHEVVEHRPEGTGAGTDESMTINEEDVGVVPGTFVDASAGDGAGTEDEANA